MLITGASGFIGIKLAAYLNDKNIYTTLLVLPGDAHNIPHHPLRSIVEWNLCSTEGLLSVLSPKTYDVLFHLAWQGVSTTHKNDYDMQVKNLLYAKNVMLLAKDLFCPKVICPGSVSEYAYVDGPVTGKEVPCPADIYGVMKVSVHSLCNLMAQLYSINFNWLLIPSIYGPGRHDNNLITSTIRGLLRGQHIQFTKLEQQWDYIYIDDLIQALYLTAKNGISGKTYVAGSGHTRKLQEYVHLIHEAIDPSAPLGIGELPYKTNRIDNAITDISALSTDTGYQPSVSFENGIKMTINYFRQEEME